VRKLMWFTIGFTTACIVGAYMNLGNWLLLGGIVCLAFGVPFCFFRPKAIRIVAAVLLGCAIGFVWNFGFQQLYLREPKSFDGQKMTVTVTATDYSYDTDNGTAVDGSFAYGSKTYRVKVYIYDQVSLRPGDRITSEFTFRYTAQGAKSDPTYHQGKGIFLLAYTGDDLQITKGSDQAPEYFAVRLRRTITQKIDQLFSDDVAAFARALLLGDSSKMSYEMGTAFSVSGIRHVIAVSGLHVSILFSVIYTLCVYRRHLTAILGIPILFIFAAVAGFTPSVVRACLMQTLVIFSMVLSKEYDPPTSLAFSVLALLAANPQCITSVSFQLSVACMIGIFGFSDQIHKYLIARKWAKGAAGKGVTARVLRMTITSVSISLSVWAITTPLCAIHFGMVSVVSILTNLLTVWMVSYIFCGIMLACLLSIVWIPLAVLAAWLTAWPMRLVQIIALGLAKIPFGAVYTCNQYTVMWLVFCYALLLAFMLLRFGRPVLLITCMLTGLVLSCTAAVVSESQIESRITILDVGQGQCILLKHRGGYYLVDCGGRYDHEAADQAAEYLLSRGVYGLDGVILTHYDTDHAGGLLPLMTRLEVEHLYLPDIDPDSSVRLELTEQYADRIKWIRGTQALSDSNITMFCGEDQTSDNESGICVLFQPDNCDILILGDRGRSGELALMEQTNLPELELLVVGHHGSAGATSLELLLETRPRAAVISVGDNSYGHPAPEVLERLDDFGCTVYRTDMCGTIEFGR